MPKPVDPKDNDVHPSLRLRKIIHFDMDAFYASVEVRDRPELKGKPVIVGGSPQSRGVVCTASYEARKFGVKSAMACARAYRLCPQAVFLRPDFEKYTKVSQQIRDIFRKYTDKIEPLSLDEAYLDVTDNPAGLYAVKIAQLIQQEIYATLQLTGSAGVGPNKMIAKIASDLKKPFGISVILPEQVRSFMEHLPLRKIHGIGPASEKRLAAHGLHVCRDVWNMPYEELEGRLGNLAAWLHARAQGIDERPLSTSRTRKSIGRETTFSEDTSDPAILDGVLARLATSVAGSCRRGGVRARTVTLKVRFDDFSSITRSHTGGEYICAEEDILGNARALFAQAATGPRKIRLLGISLAGLQKQEDA